MCNRFKVVGGGRVRERESGGVWQTVASFHCIEERECMFSNVSVLSG